MGGDGAYLGGNRAGSVQLVAFTCLIQPVGRVLRVGGQSGSNRSAPCFIVRLVQVGAVVGRVY